MKNSSHPKKNSPPTSEPKIMPDDRLGPDEPPDEAADLIGEAPEVAGPEGEEPSSGHRVRKFEPDDEHNNENLVERGLLGSMKNPRKKPPTD